MGHQPKAHHRRSGRVRTVAVILAAIFAVAALPGPALAAGEEEGHGEESNEARVLVMQAIALIVNEADAERVVERIADAVEAPEKEGVDLAKVEQALGVAESVPGRAGLNEARLLLQESIGAQPVSGYGEVAPIGEVSEGQPPPFATGADPGTGAVLDPVRPDRGISDGGDAVLLALAVAGLGLGLYLSYRFRPAHSIHQLRREDSAHSAAEAKS